jgi:PAS domain S-box-containing protein
MSSDHTTRPDALARLTVIERWGLVLAIAAVYFGVAKLGLTMAFVAEQVTVVWPPTGLSLAALILFGYRAWPAITLGAFLANATTDVPLATALGAAVGNTLEAVSGSWMLSRFVGFEPALQRLKDVMGLILLAAGLSTIISATIGVTSLCLAELQPWRSFGSIWWIWWLGDATSDLVVAPLLLTLFGRRWSQSHWPTPRIIEAGILIVALAIVALCVFGVSTSDNTTHPLVYAVFPFIIWAALRFGQTGSTSVTLIASAVAIWATVRGLGPFATQNVHESLILIQLFMAVMAVTGMLLAAAITASRQAARRASAQYAVARILAEWRTREDTLRRVLEAVRHSFEWDVAALWVLDRGEDVLRLMEMCSAPNLKIPEFETESWRRKLPCGLGLPGRVWATAQPLWLVDVLDNTNFPRLAAATREHLRGALGVPILFGDQVFGAMEFFSRDVHPPDADLLEMTAAVGRQIGQFIERTHAEEALQRSEERYRSFIHQSSEGIWRCELEQTIPIDEPEDRQIEDMYRFASLAECNDAMGRMYGFSSGAEILQARLGDLLPPSDPHNIEYLRSFIRSGYRLGEAESHEIDKDGNSKYFLNTMVGIVEDGRLVRAWGTQRDITEQRRIARQLRESDEKFRAMVETANEGIWVLDEAARITFVNDRMAEMLGYQPDEMLGRIEWDFLFQEDEDASRELFSRRRAGISEQADVRFQHKDGREVWTILCARPITDHQGRFRGALDLFTDVTERRRAEEALRENEERLRLAMGAGEIGAWDWDVARDRVIWSDRIYAIHGMQPGTFGGRSEDFIKLIHPADAASVWEGVQRALDEGAPYRLEFRIVRPGGEVRWIATSATVIRAPDGKPLRMLGATIDTTERKQAEEALRESEEFRRRILESTQDCVQVLDLHGKLLSMNEGGQRVLEIDAINGLLHTSWIDFWQGEDRAAAERAVAVAVTGGLGQFEGLLPTRKTHTPRWWDVVVTPMLGTDRRPVQLLAVAHDLTDRRRGEDALREADRRKDEFLAMLAHELRNPLAAISSAASLSRQPHLGEQDRRWSQDVIERQVRHLARLIDDLLDISRITRGKIELRKELVDARPILVQAIESVQPLIRDRSHELNISSTPGTLPLEVDATRLEQIVVNLLTNAAKYTEPGGRIWLSAQQEGGEIVIRVRDTGMGIPPEKIPAMFELFVQGDRSLARSEGGLGIGLTLVKTLVEMHFGSVSASSAGPGKGSEFTVRLPAGKRAAARPGGKEIPLARRTGDGFLNP